MSEPTKQVQNTNEEETVSNEAERCYRTYSGENALGFDPLKDLNLPGSYQEMMDRLGRLGGDRATEALN